MDEELSCPDSPADPDSQQRRRWGPYGLLIVIDGVLTAVGTVYLTTESIAVTVIAAAVTLALVALYWVTQS